MVVFPHLKFAAHFTMRIYNDDIAAVSTYEIHQFT